MFDFSRSPITVVRIRRGDAEACYHLSKGKSSYILRRNGTATRYLPSLADLPDDAEVVEELSLEEVSRITGSPVRNMSIKREPDTWDEVLDTLEALPQDLAGRSDRTTEQAPDEGLAPKSSAGKVIPATDMRQLYLVLKEFNSLAFHLDMAREATRVPIPIRLGQRFRTSVEQFSVYRNVREPFHDGREPLEQREVKEVTSTEDLTSLLVHRMGKIGSVANDAQLSFAFVDREIVPTRTTGRAKFWDGRTANHGKRLDWLLANAEDGRPIIAEVKVNDDMNLFYASVQSLMYAAEFATGSQVRRLTWNYPDQFQIPSGIEDDGEPEPLVDVYLVLCGYNRRSRERREILKLTETLWEHLMEQPTVTAHIRRAACLEADRQDEGNLRFTKLFRFPPAGGT